MARRSREVKSVRDRLGKRPEDILTTSVSSEVGTTRGRVTTDDDLRSRLVESEEERRVKLQGVNVQVRLIEGQIG